MLPRIGVAFSVALTLLLAALSVPASALDSYVDDFPLALPNYRTGGWQGPYGDGTAGRVVPTDDSRGIYMDATYNGLAYAFRKAPEFADVELAVTFVIPTRDFTVADNMVLYLRWHNTTYPGQSSCPDCTYPSAESGFLVSFNLGEERIFLMNASGSELATRPFSLSIAGLPHEARVNVSKGVATVYVDGTNVIEAVVPDSPAGLIGIQAYRVDVIVDVVRINAPGAAPDQPPSNPPANPPGTPSNPAGMSAATLWTWLVALTAGLVGLVGVLVAVMAVLLRIRRRPPPP